MPKSVIISSHARQRAAERLELSRRDDVVHKFRHAIMYGLSPSCFKGPFNQYLQSKLRKNSHCTIKIYSDFVYIHRNKKLITMFPVPEKYLPVKQWLPANYNKIIEVENEPELQLKRLYHSGDFKFYIKNPGKNGNTYLVALVIKEELASVSRGKDLEKQKVACVAQHLAELRNSTNIGGSTDGNIKKE